MDQTLVRFVSDERKLLSVSEYQLMMSLSFVSYVNILILSLDYGLITRLHAIFLHSNMPSHPDFSVVWSTNISTGRQPSDFRGLCTGRIEPTVCTIPFWCAFRGCKSHYRPSPTKRRSLLSQTGLCSEIRVGSISVWFELVSSKARRDCRELCIVQLWILFPVDATFPSETPWRRSNRELHVEVEDDARSRLRHQRRFILLRTRTVGMGYRYGYRYREYSLCVFLTAFWF